MKVKTRRVGNSLTVTIPKEIAMDLNLRPDVEMEVSVQSDVIVMEPMSSRWDRLVAEVRALAAERGLTERDIELALAESRSRRT